MTVTEVGTGPDPSPATWRETWSATAGEVGNRSTARWLCEEASGAWGHDFDALLDEVPTSVMRRHLDEMLARHRAGEPLQYVLGHWAFRRLDLLVDRRVLIPRPETEVVAGMAIDLARRCLRERAGGSPLRCVDLGTGSGAIGLSLVVELPRGAADVWLTDRSPAAIDVARANAAGVGIAGAGVRLAAGDWFEALPDDLHGRLDLVVSNPPYVATDDPDIAPDVVAWEPGEALWGGSDGMAAIRAVVSGAVSWLAPGGWVVVEIGAAQGGAAATVARDAGLVEVAVRPDLAGRDRILVGRRAM